MSRRRRPRLAVGLLAFLLALAGCSTLLAVKGEQRRADALAVLSGTVTAELAPSGPLVVALFAREAEDYVLVDDFTAARPGPWIFGVQAGRYWVAAFEDVNGDGAYQDEPFYRPDPERPLVVTPGQRVTGLAIVVPRAGRALRSGRFVMSGMTARETEEQQRTSIFALSAVGTVAALDDPRFDFDIAKKGMWQFYEFLAEGEAGIYFLEPYDPQRIPVLFVHGMGGTPREFATLIGALDRRRFQPWVLYYPSGARLDAIVTWLDQIFTRLEVELKVEKAAVVAHSMGGLVARGFALQHWDRSGRDAVRTLVTISSPLGGIASAGEGVADSPIVVRSWATPGARQRLPRRALVHRSRTANRAAPAAGAHGLSHALRLQGRRPLGLERRHGAGGESAARRGPGRGPLAARLRRGPHGHPPQPRGRRAARRDPRRAEMTRARCRRDLRIRSSRGGGAAQRRA